MPLPVFNPIVLPHRTPGWMRMVLSVLCLAHMLARVEAATLKAALDRDTIAAGEAARLTLTVEGGVPDFAPEPAAIPNLLIQYQSNYQESRSINGRKSFSVSLYYAVASSQPGTYQIPALTLTAGGQQLTSNPLQLKVLAADADPNGTAKVAFIRLIVPKKEAFLGEVIPVELQLYLQSAENLQLPQLSGEGFTFSKPIEGGRSRAQSNGQLYNVLVFKLTATAVKTGELQLGPAECELTLLIQQQRRRRGDPSDPFGDLSDFFGNRAERRQVKLTSAFETINVSPLPDSGKPADFSGAVGIFQFQSVASPLNLSAGDPITLVTRITGRGNLDGIQFSVPAWNNFRIYPANSKTEADPLGIEGTKTFEQVVAPEIAEIRELPALQFSFFNPQTKAYETLRQPAVPLTVKAVAAPQAQPAIVAANQPEAAATARKDIVHIKTRLALATASAPPWQLRPWFWIANLIPVGLLTAALLRQRWLDYLAQNPAERRRREVVKIVDKALKELESAAAQNQAEPFYQTLFRLLQEQLGELVGLPASSITESVIEDDLLPRGLPDPVAKDLHELFQACNTARYAPQAAAGGLAALLTRTQATVGSLRGLNLEDKR